MTARHDYDYDEDLMLTHHISPLCHFLRYFRISERALNFVPCILSGFYFSGFYLFFLVLGISSSSSKFTFTIYTHIHSDRSHENHDLAARGTAAAAAAAARTAPMLPSFFVLFFFLLYRGGGDERAAMQAHAPSSVQFFFFF
jgi:hypothetical protein